MDPIVLRRELKLGVLVHIKLDGIACSSIVTSDEAGRNFRTAQWVGTIVPRAGPGGDAGEL